jgi:hypothetical protein
MEQFERVLQVAAQGRTRRLADLHAYERLLAPDLAPEVRRTTLNRAARRRLAREALR